MHRISLFIVTIFFFALHLTVIPFNRAHAQMLDSLDRSMIDSALTLLKLDPSELGFDKLWVEDDTFRLAVVEDLLSAPLALPDYVDETTTTIDSMISHPYDLLKFIGNQLKVDSKEKSLKPPELSEMTFDINDPFKLWVTALERAEPHRLKFYEKLDSLDLHDLIMAAPTMWGDDDDSTSEARVGSWQREFNLPVDTSREVNSDRLLDIMKKLDINELIIAGMITAPAAQMTAKGFGMSRDEWIKKEPISEPVEGVVGTILAYRETEWGKLVIGGGGDNIYYGDFAVIVDIGGDDIYRGRVAGAMGELSLPYSLVIDLEGNDVYDSGDKDVAHGSGFLGIGILVDRGGDDSYRSNHYAQGSGFFGIGIFADHKGRDDRRGGYFMQGAGHCGVGILIDDGDEGDDRYQAYTWAQGFASTFGYGLLYESGGDDNYRTGAEYYHAPLLPHDYRSFSGGFGMGWRPRAGGGIGVLYDKGDGNDFYGAEVMSFGSSYWYSLGILVDGGGNDHYTLAHYGLGSGIHLSLGALYDVSGDDQYRSRHGVVGATPHDLSVGMMVDGSGDDYYMVSDGWGGSLTNSFGLFVDRLGNDTYGTRGKGHSFGSVRWARGFAGAAIFLDLEGDDVYTADNSAADSSTWIQTGWGIGMDLPRDVVDTEKEEEIGEIILTAEDSARSVEEIFEDASAWEVGNAKEKVKRGRKALVAKGVEAIDWVLENKLDSKSGLEHRAINELFKSLPDTVAPQLIELFPMLDEEQPLKNVIAWLAELKREEAVDPLLKLLKKRSDLADKVRRSVMSALGKIGDKKAAKPISKFVTDDKERNRLASLNALKELKETETIERAVKGLDDPLFTVRSAAIGATVAFGVDAVPLLTEFVNNDNSKYPEMGVKALKNIVIRFDDELTPEQMRVRYDVVLLLEESLSSSDEHVRAEAVSGLYRIGKDATRQLIVSRMENEYSPVVLAAYEQVKKSVGE